eukprot:gene3177-3479_t
MGGGRRYEYPKWVWSPSGGWWADPVHWKRNTIFCGVVIAATAFAVYQYSESKTRTFYPKYVESAESHGHGHGKGHH